MRLESLESRQLFAADYRSFDGTQNNLVHPQWGSTDEAFLRTVAAEYSDGISAPAGSDRASARTISNLVSAQTTDSIDERGLSAFIYAWGQFIDHDIDLTPTGTTGESLPISVPTGDPSFDPQSTGTQTISLTRSLYDAATGTTAARQQINAITAYIDGSMIYGNSSEVAKSLREFFGGRLLTTAGNLLPTKEGMFVAGDLRVNENPELTAMHTLFLREHNRIATQLSKANPFWNDERLYQEARRIVIGEIQSITFNEFLPALLGENAIAPYRGYNANVNPGIANEFATAAFRIGHSMLGSNIQFLNNDGEPLRDPVGLQDAFFNPSIISLNGIDGILKYLASDNANMIDTEVIDDVRNFLFGAPGSGGLDLAALNIQRGRDHGIADYNQVRKAYGLKPVRSFAEITSDVKLQQALKTAYGNVDNIDLWVGGLAEDHAPGASVGPTFQRIIANQFIRLRDGDRYWYEKDLSGSALAQVRSITLAKVIRNNTTVDNLQNNVFFFRTSISGRVFVDSNQNGKQDQREHPAEGIALSLIDRSGNVVATTTSRRDGSYRFDQIPLGKYRVVRSATTTNHQTTETSSEVTLSRGMEIRNTDLAISEWITDSQPKPGRPAPPPVDSPHRLVSRR